MSEKSHDMGMMSSELRFKGQGEIKEPAMENQDCSGKQVGKVERSVVVAR